MLISLTYGQKLKYDVNYIPGIHFQYPIGALYEGKIDSSRKLLIAGYIENPSFPYNINVIRLDSIGAVDNSYSQFPNAMQTGGGVDDFVTIRDTTYFQIMPNYIVKCNSTGIIIDQSWTNNFWSSNTSVGMIHLPEEMESPNFIFGIDSIEFPAGSGLTKYLLRCNIDGSYDSLFNHNANGVVEFITNANSSHKILLGQFDTYDGVAKKFICKIDSTGNLDASFSSPFDRVIEFREVIVDRNGKILIGGRMILNNSTDTISLIRLNVDGTIDQSFNYGLSFIHQATGMPVIRTICQTNDGGYLLGGLFSNIEGIIRNNIAKIDSNGQLDLFELNGTGADSSAHLTSGYFPVVAHIIRDSTSYSEKYYVLGYFNRFNGHIVDCLFRLVMDSTQSFADVGKIEGKIYPNPIKCNGSLQIEFADNVFCKDVFVYSIDGRLILHVIINRNSQHFSFPVENAAPGMYILNVKTTMGLFRERFVVN